MRVWFLIHLKQTCQIVDVFFPIPLPAYLSIWIGDEELKLPVFLCIIQIIIIQYHKQNTMSSISPLKKRIKTGSPSPCRQDSVELSIFLITTFALILCVSMSPCVRLVFDIPLFLLSCCLCVSLCSAALWNQLCVCCTWLTCSRRAG